jgi:hypothetical protein
LKEKIKKPIAEAWIEMVQQVESFVSKLCEQAVAADTDFLYALFSDLYTARRRYWLTNLDRNPVILMCLFLFGLFLFLPNYPQFAPGAGIPWSATGPWHAAMPIAFGAAYCAFKGWQLNPSKQFVPPRLSAFGVQTQLREIAKNLGQDLQEATVGGIAAGALLGTFILPGIGTVVGAGIGAFVGFFTGESLSSLQEKVDQQIMADLDLGLQQLDDRIGTWIKRQKTQYTQAATESFARNIQKVTKFLVAHRGEAKRLAVEARLLLPAPTDQKGESDRPQSVDSGLASPRPEGQEASKDIPGFFSLWRGPAVVLMVGLLMVMGSQYTKRESLPISPLSIQPPLSETVSLALVTVSVDKANIRSGPGSGFPVIGQTKRGDSFPIKSREGDWYQVSYGAQEVWIHKSTVREEVQAEMPLPR